MTILLMSFRGTRNIIQSYTILNRCLLRRHDNCIDITIASRYYSIFNSIYLSNKLNFILAQKIFAKTKPLTSIKKSSSFFIDVYDVVRKIPKGRVSTYGAIANYLGTKSSARMVGWAMNTAHSIYPEVPAHRVVNRNGMLSGKAHFATPTFMEELLEKEKIKIEKDTVVDFEKKFWDPFTELGL